MQTISKINGRVVYCHKYVTCNFCDIWRELDRNPLAVLFNDMRPLKSKTELTFLLAGNKFINFAKIFASLVTKP